MAASHDYVDLDFTHCHTLNDVLLLAINHCEEARLAPDSVTLETHLKMASRALRCALEIHGDWLTEQVQRGKHDSVQSDYDVRPEPASEVH